MELKIDAKQFEDIYGMEMPDIFLRDPIDEDDLWANFMPSKLWRLTTCILLLINSVKKYDL